MKNGVQFLPTYVLMLYNYPNKTMGCTQYEFSTTDNRSSRLVGIAYTYVNFYTTSVTIIIKVSI